MLTFSSSFSTADFSLSDLSNWACFSAPSWKKKKIAFTGIVKAKHDFSTPDLIKGAQRPV